MVRQEGDGCPKEGEMGGRLLAGEKRWVKGAQAVGSQPSHIPLALPLCDSGHRETPGKSWLAQQDRGQSHE